VGAGVVVWLLFALLTRKRVVAHPAESFLRALEARLAAAKVRPAVSETIEELSQRLTRGGHPLAPAVEQATRRYLEARFGQRPLGQAERAALLAALERRGQSPPP
jgi:hypothetical protein